MGLSEVHRRTPLTLMTICRIRKMLKVYVRIISLNPMQAEPASLTFDGADSSSSSSLLLSSLELNDTTIYDPEIRALLGTAQIYAKHLVRVQARNADMESQLDEERWPIASLKYPSPDFRCCGFAQVLTQ